MLHSRRLAAATLTLLLAAPTPLLSQDMNLVTQPSLTAVHNIHELAASNPLLKPAGLHVRDVLLAEALSALRSTSGVALAFSPSLLPAERVSCHCELASVGQALEQMLAGTSFRYVVVTGQILVEPMPRQLRADMLSQLDHIRVELSGDRGAALRTPIPISGTREGTITGRVVADGTLEPLVGAQVSILGTNLGTLTNAEGRYLIAGVPDGEVTVRAQRIGYGGQEKTVTVVTGETIVVNFELAERAIGLEEIVASVSAGDVSRREMGTDIGLINTDEILEAAVVTNLSDLLSGRAPSVNINATSGNVGGGSMIRVRGINSLTQGNNPLVIIDGVRASNSTDVGINRGQTFSRLNDVNPANIAKIQVIKGPSATALYGSEAASGVIIIQTKSGQAVERDGMRISMELERGYMWDTAEYPGNWSDVTPFVTGPDDPKLDGWRVETNPISGQVFVVDNPFEDASTSPFRRGRTSNASIQLSGGGDNVSYFTSLSYDDQLGVLPNNDLSRINFRANLQATPTDQLTLTANSGYVNSAGNLPKSGNNTSGFFLNALGGNPYFSRNSQGECLATVLLGDDENTCDRKGNIRAPFDAIANIVSREDLERFIGSLGLKYSPAPWLVNQAVVGVDVADQVFNDAIPFQTANEWFGFAAGGEFFRTRFLRRHITADVSSTASYGLRESLTGHTTIGAQYFGETVDMIACQGRVFVNNQANACDAAVSLRGFSDVTEQVEVGAFLQQGLAYNNYFYLTGALRVDNNSSLGRDEPVIWSPSFNTSLVVSDLPIWNVDPELVNNLRVRGAWGTASNSPAPYAAQRTYGIVRLAQGSEIVPGLSPDEPGNPNLGPERVTEIEAGFDSGLLNDRIGLHFTFFRQTTENAIVPRPVAPSTGFASSQLVNLGKLQNTGIEASLDATLYQNDVVRWNALFSTSWNRSRIAELGQQNGFAGFWEGYAPSAYTTCVVTDARRAEDGAIIPGSIEYAPGNLLEGDCRRVVGNSFPTNRQSLSTNLTLFDNLQLSMLFDRVAGHRLSAGSISDARTQLAADYSEFGRIWAFRQRDLSPVEQATIEEDANVGNRNLVWLPRADFIKFRELKVSYTLPTSLTMAVGASNTQLYVGGRNIHIWTDFPGISPEVNTDGARDEIGRAAGAALPPPFMLFSGIRVNF